MKAAPKTVAKTNGKPGRPKPPFDPYVDELNRRLQDPDTDPPANLHQAAAQLADWGQANRNRLLSEFGIRQPIHLSAIRKRLDKRFSRRHYLAAVAERKALIVKSQSVQSYKSNFSKTAQQLF